MGLFHKDKVAGMWPQAPSSAKVTMGRAMRHWQSGVEPSLYLPSVPALACYRVDFPICIKHAIIQCCLHTTASYYSSLH